MSWDVLVFAAKEPPPPVAELPGDWQGEPHGTVVEVRRKISECLPGVDWADPAWGIFEGDGFSFEFSIGAQDLSDSFMVHVRGHGDAVTPLLRLAEHWNWYLLDFSQGEWLHQCSDANAGWQDFQEYRNRMLRHNSAEDKV